MVGKFVSPNVMKLSLSHLSKDKISLLSKVVKFIPTSKHINEALIKEELETYGKMFKLMWHYRDEQREITINSFKKKSKFIRRQKDAAIEIYLGRLEKTRKLSYSNLRKEAICSLKDDTSIITKDANKGSGIGVWEREDYLAEARTQLKNKDGYQEL